MPLFFGFAMDTFLGPNRRIILCFSFTYKIGQCSRGGIHSIIHSINIEDLLYSGCSAQFQETQR